MSKRSSSSSSTSSVEETLKRRRLLYRHNLATLRPDGSYRNGENPYETTLRDELRKLGPVAKDLSSSRLLASSTWRSQHATFRMHEFELTKKVASYSLSNYVRRYEESPTISDTLTEEQLRTAFKFNERPRSERPYEMTLYADLWHEKYQRLFKALDDSEYEEQQRSNSQNEWFNDGGVDIFPPPRGAIDWGKQFLHYIATKHMWSMKFKSLPTTQIVMYDAKSNLIYYSLNPFQRKITKPNDGTQHGHQEVLFPNSTSFLRDPNERDPYFIVAPFEKGAETLHVIGGELMFQATIGQEYKLCASASSDRNVFQAYFDPDFSTAIYDANTKTLKLQQSNIKVSDHAAEYKGTFNGTSGQTLKIAYNKIILRDYFYNSELDDEDTKLKKILRGAENISLYSLKNNTIGDPTNIDKICQLKSFSDFLTHVNQICTNARKYYGSNSTMHNAGKELLAVAKEEVQNSRDNLLYRFKNENVSFERCRGQAVGERAEEDAIRLLLSTYGPHSKNPMEGIDRENILDYECVRRLAVDMNPGDPVDEERCCFLHWITRFKAKYPKMMAVKKLQIKAEATARR